MSLTRPGHVLVGDGEEAQPWQKRNIRQIVTDNRTIFIPTSLFRRYPNALFSHQYPFSLARLGLADNHFAGPKQCGCTALKIVRHGGRLQMGEAGCQKRAPLTLEKNVIIKKALMLFFKKTQTIARAATP